MNFMEIISKFIGVSWFKQTKKWKAQITIDGKSKHLGYFISEIKASEAYQKAFKNEGLIKIVIKRNSTQNTEEFMESFVKMNKLSEDDKENLMIKLKQYRVLSTSDIRLYGIIIKYFSNI